MSDARQTPETRTRDPTRNSVTGLPNATPDRPGSDRPPCLIADPAEIHDAERSGDNFQAVAYTQMRRL